MDYRYGPSAPQLVWQAMLTSLHAQRSTSPTKPASELVEQAVRDAVALLGQYRAVVAALPDDERG